MSRPLIANRKRENEAHNWHKQVFAMFGSQCVLCKRKERATDAGHVIGRAHLGKLRYADPRLGRPLHRDCHERVDRNEIDWPKAILRDAIKAHNALAKCPLQVPTA